MPTELPATSASLRAEEAHSVAQRLCEELTGRLSAAEADGQSQSQTMAAEIDDLNKTKAFLEERLIELIRYHLTWTRWVSVWADKEGGGCQVRKRKSF